MLTAQLTQPQLDATARMQQALVTIAKLAHRCNEAIKTHGLPLQPLIVLDVSRLYGDLDNLAFHHDCAKSADAANTLVMQHECDRGLVS